MRITIRSNEHMLLGIFIISIFADLVTTLINGELVEYLEANPLYPYGGLVLIFAFNIIFSIVLFLIYNLSKNPTNRFLIAFVVVSATITRFLVAYNNYQLFLNPPTIEQAMLVTNAAKVASNLLWNDRLPRQCSVKS